MWTNKQNSKSKAKNNELVLEVEITESLAKLINSGADFMSANSILEVTVVRTPPATPATESPTNSKSEKNDLKTQCKKVPGVKSDPVNTNIKAPPKSVNRKNHEGLHSKRIGQYSKSLPFNLNTVEMEPNVALIKELVAGEVFKLIGKPQNELGTFAYDNRNQNTLRDQIPEKDVSNTLQSLADSSEKIKTTNGDIPSLQSVSTKIENEIQSHNFLFQKFWGNFSAGSSLDSNSATTTPGHKNILEAFHITNLEKVCDSTSSRTEMESEQESWSKRSKSKNCREIPIHSTTVTVPESNPPPRNYQNFCVFNDVCERLNTLEAKVFHKDANQKRTVSVQCTNSKKQPEIKLHIKDKKGNIVKLPKEKMQELQDVILNKILKSTDVIANSKSNCDLKTTIDEIVNNRMEEIRKEIQKLQKPFDVLEEIEKVKKQQRHSPDCSFKSLENSPTPLKFSSGHKLQNKDNEIQHKIPDFSIKSRYSPQQRLEGGGTMRPVSPEIKCRRDEILAVEMQDVRKLYYPDEINLNIQYPDSSKSLVSPLPLKNLPARFHCNNSLKLSEKKLQKNISSTNTSIQNASLKYLKLDEVSSIFKNDHSEQPIKPTIKKSKIPKRIILPCPAETKLAKALPENQVLFSCHADVSVQSQFPENQITSSKSVQTIAKFVNNPKLKWINLVRQKTFTMITDDGKVDANKKTGNKKRGSLKTNSVINHKRAKSESSGRKNIIRKVEILENHQNGSDLTKHLKKADAKTDLEKTCLEDWQHPQLLLNITNPTTETGKNNLYRKALLNINNPDNFAIMREVYSKIRHQKNETIPTDTIKENIVLYRSKSASSKISTEDEFCDVEMTISELERLVSPTEST